MIKSIVRKSLVKKGPTSLDIRGVVTSNKTSSENLYDKIRNHNGRCKICIIRRLGGIGDVLMCTPALRQIKRDWPEVDLTFAIDMHSTSNNVYYELVRNAPFIDHVVDARYIKGSDYIDSVDISSVCIRHEHSGLPTLNRIDIFAKACSIQKLIDKRSWYKIESEEYEWAQSISASWRNLGKKVVVLHTASMEGKRSWPTEKYLELVEQATIDALPIQFIIIDFNRKFDKWEQYSNCYNASNTTLRQMAALIGSADFFIGPDSGPMHLAGAIGTPSLVIFGSIPPEARINYYPTHESVRLNLSCIGCWYRPCPYDVKCMRDLDSKLVYNKMRRRLDV